MTVDWREISSTPLWLDDPSAPQPAPRLDGDTHCDLAVVGGGFCGLWTALRAKERDPACDVVLVEGRTVGWAASGRNGGFVSASLTHGLANGASRWPDELTMLERLGLANLDAMERAVREYGIDCSFERTGKLAVATEPHQVDELRQLSELAARHGRTIEYLDRSATRTMLDSRTFLAGAYDRAGYALVNPAKLAWGLREVCLRLGVRLYERTPVRAVDHDRAGVTVRTARSRVSARRLVLATNAFRPLLRRLAPYTVPVYDYALATEPLSADALAAVGWSAGQAMSDSGNQFHYYRRTPDDRILWGGYDAIYHYGSKLTPRLDRRPATFTKLAAQFAETFPQLAGTRFTHAWGGAVDTCTRFTAFFGTAHAGRTAYALGFTGLGVAATRFAADVMLDLLAGDDTERTRLTMVRSKPVPFPPEPVRYLGIQATRRSLAAEDATGRRNRWLRTLDRLGMGFDS